MLQHLRIPFVNQGVDEVNRTMVDKTNVLEIQLNGTQSGCKFSDVKGAEKNKPHNTAKHGKGLLVPLVPTLAPMIRHGVNVKVTPLRVHLYSKSNH